MGQHKEQEKADGAAKPPEVPQSDSAMEERETKAKGNTWGSGGRKTLKHIWLEQYGVWEHHPEGSDYFSELSKRRGGTFKCVISNLWFNPRLEIFYTSYFCYSKRVRQESVNQELRESFSFHMEGEHCNRAMTTWA